MPQLAVQQLAQFTAQLKQLNNEAQFQELAARLREHPGLGPVIRGAGGARKIRVGMPGRGKRGGARIIYLWLPEAGQLIFLRLYAKNEAEDLTAKEKKTLATIAAGIKVQFQNAKGKKGR